MTITNWAGNFRYGAARVRRPTSVAHVADLIMGSDAVHALGSRHSFNDIADTPGDLILMEALPADCVIDPETCSVAVGGGVSYGRLARELTAAGWAVHNLASLPHISVAGAVATGTHGSGDRNRSLAAAVSGLEIVTGTGDLVTLHRPDTDFPGAVVNLGALGVVTRVWLDIEPAFDVRQYVFEHLPFDELTANFDHVTGSGYSVSVFTDWTGDAARQVWVKTKSDHPPTMFSALPAGADMHPLPNMSAQSCSPQMGVPGTWSDRLAHFKMEFTPSNGAEVQTEYLLPRTDAGAAIEALRALSPKISPLLLVSEIRTVAASDLWLDPAYGRDSVALHFTWLPDQAAVEKVLPLIEGALAPYDPRPHWGKLFAVSAADLSARYDRLPDFRDLADRCDPRGVFRNAYLRRLVFS